MRQTNEEQQAFPVVGFLKSIDEKTDVQQKIKTV